MLQSHHKRGSFFIVPTIHKGLKMKVELVPINMLLPNPKQTRFGYEDLDNEDLLKSQDIIDLADSIEKHGLKQPIGITLLHGCEKLDYPQRKYYVEYGHRRVLAHKRLKRDEIAAIINPSDLSDDELRMTSIIENLQRKNLNLIEEGTFYHELYDKYDSLEKMSQLLKVQSSRIVNAMKIVKKLHPEIIKDLLKPGTKKDIIFLYRLCNLHENPEIQIKIFREFRDGKLDRESGMEKVDLIVGSNSLKGRPKRIKTLLNGEVKAVYDKQGLKIRSEIFNRLNQEEKIYFEKDLQELFGKFIKTIKTRERKEADQKEFEKPIELEEFQRGR